MFNDAFEMYLEYYRNNMIGPSFAYSLINKDPILAIRTEDSSSLGFKTYNCLDDDNKRKVMKNKLLPEHNIAGIVRAFNKTSDIVDGISNAIRKAIESQNVDGVTKNDLNELFLRGKKILGLDWKTCETNGLSCIYIVYCIMCTGYEKYKQLIDSMAIKSTYGSIDMFYTIDVVKLKEDIDYRIRFLI